MPAQIKSLSSPILLKVNPRQGRYSKILPALVLYLTFFLLLSTSRSLIEDAVIPAFSIWSVHIIFLGLGIFLHMQSIGLFSYNKKNTKKIKVES